MDLASVVAALASVGVRVSGSTPNNNIQGDSSRACPTGLAGPEPSGTLNDPGQHFHKSTKCNYWLISAETTSFLLELYIFFRLCFFKTRQKMAQMMTKAFSLDFCSVFKTRAYEESWSKYGAFAVMLTMQFRPPKR